MYQIQNILLLDDDPDDCFLFRKVLNEVSSKTALRCLHDCDDLLPSMHSELPDMIFMDINMPKMTGFESIASLKNNAVFLGIPVVMYSCSDAERDISKAYGLGASLYLKKPPTYEGLVISLRKIITMDWSAPEIITREQFAGGHYHPFQGY